MKRSQRFMNQWILYEKKPKRDNKFKLSTVKKLAKVIAQYKIGQLPRPSF